MGVTRVNLLLSFFISEFLSSEEMNKNHNGWPVVDEYYIIFILRLMCFFLLIFFILKPITLLAMLGLAALQGL